METAIKTLIKIVIIKFLIKLRCIYSFLNLRTHGLL